MTKERASGILAALSVAAIIAINWFLPLLNASPQHPASAVGTLPFVAWLLTLALLVFLLSQIGRGLNDRPAGLVIDNRNRVSLSKLQMIGWTVLVISGLIALAATKLAALPHCATSFNLTTELLVLMGISATSLVATPALLSLKPAGAVDSRASADHARWTDIFLGDDESNKDSPDISKIQQVLITLLVMTYYAFQLGNMFRFGNGSQPIALPNLDPQLVWLVGISHAGYLSYKAVPHSAPDGTKPAAPPAPPPPPPPAPVNKQAVG